MRPPPSDDPFSTAGSADARRIKELTGSVLTPLETHCLLAGSYTMFAGLCARVGDGEYLRKNAAQAVGHLNEAGRLLAASLAADHPPTATAVPDARAGELRLRLTAVEFDCLLGARCMALALAYRLRLPADDPLVRDACAALDQAASAARERALDAFHDQMNDLADVKRARDRVN